MPKTKPLLDPQQPITVFDDRGRADEDLMVTHVLYVNDRVILARVVPYRFDRHGLLKTEEGQPEDLLIARDTGEVQNSAYDAWIAENPAETRVPAPVIGSPGA